MFNFFKKSKSFGAIVRYKGNGGIVHYRPIKCKCAEIKDEGILLVDSGSRYEGGTTDITRTLSLSPPTQEQKRNFTLVLKGHIALAQARFPKGTTGQQLDLCTPILMGCRIGLWPWSQTWSRVLS